MRILVCVFMALTACGWAQSNNTCNANGCPPVVFLNYSPLGLACNNGPQTGFYNGTQYVCINSVVVAVNSSNATTLTITGTPSMVTPINTGLLNLGVAPYTDTGIIENFWYNYNGYIYNAIGNTSTGAAASACYLIGNSATTALTNYGELCLNGTGYSGSGEYNAASATLLDSVGGDIGIGTATPNIIHFFVNANPVDSMKILASGMTQIADVTIASILPVSGTPTGTPATTGGTVAAGANYAKIVAIDGGGQQTTVSTETALVTTSTATSAITWNWTAVTGAASYQIWVGATSGTEGYYYTSTTNSYVQTTPIASGTSGTMPTTNTTGSWTVTGPQTSTSDIAGGTKFVIASGCATSATSGGALAGSFTASSTTCSPVITPGVTAPNGFACTVTDMTTAAATIRETAYSTTQVTFSGATLGSTDQFVFSCKEF